jgi:uncharacterized membrane protein YebE (DUF533 family)
MSLIKTLTQVAIGIAVAKGVQTITQSRTTTTTTRSTGGASTGNPAPRSPGTGRSYRADPGSLGGIMDEIMGAGQSSGRASGGSTRASTGSGTRSGTGLDDLFGSTRSTSRNRKAAPKGGLEDLLTGASGGGSLGDLLGAVLGGTTAAGGVLGGAFGGDAGRTLQPQTQRELEAAVLLRTMIMAAKADRQLDEGEKSRLMEAVGQATRAEIDFINKELSAPMDIEGLLNDIPRGMEEQAYTVSLMAIDLDQRAEAEYLHQLASGLGLEPAEVNEIHDRAGAPRIYT